MILALRSIYPPRLIGDESLLDSVTVCNMQSSNLPGVTLCYIKILGDTSMSFASVELMVVAAILLELLYCNQEATSVLAPRHCGAEAGVDWLNCRMRDD